MSLDVYLTLTRAQLWAKLEFTGEEPLKTLTDKQLSDLRDALAERYLYTSNITHNLVPMAQAAGLYECLWRPEEYGYGVAEQLIAPLQEGLDRLLNDPQKYTPYNPENNWGTYEGLVRFVQQYLEACTQHPQALVSVWR